MTSRHTFATSFQCNASKVNKKGLAPICLSISIDGKRTLVQLDKKCKPEDFRRLMDSRKGSDVKTFCDTIQAKVDEIHTYITVSGEPLTAQRVKRYLKDGIATKTHTIGDVVAECADIKQREGRDEHTINKYLNAAEHFYEITGMDCNCEIYEVKQRDIQIFIAGIKQKYAPATAAKEMKYIKHYFNYAFQNGYITSNPFGNIRIENPKPEQIYLTYDEICKIRDARIINDRLDKVRDIALFMIFSGLEYADIAALEKDDVKVNNYGQYYIKKKRVKSGIEYTSILFEDAPRIWEEYNGVLPLLSNQKMNKYVHELMEVCGIDKAGEVTTLTFRHTYGCYCVNDMALPLEITAKMMGHTNTTQTRHYAKLFDNTVFKATVGKVRNVSDSDKVKDFVGKAHRIPRPTTRKKMEVEDTDIFSTVLAKKK